MGCRVTWQGITEGSPYRAVIQPTSECIERSRSRLGDWSRRWPEVFRDMSELWLGYVGAVEGAYLAVWAEEMSGMTGNEEWATNLRAYLSGLDDPGSAGVREALAQSYLASSGNRLGPFDKVGLITAVYTWPLQAPSEGSGHGPF